MRTARSWFGLIGALLPVLFCGGFLLYFDNVRRAFGGLVDSGIGPTMIGLAVFGLLFLVLFLLKLRRFLAPPAPPASGDRVAAALDQTPSDFDPDAAFARYMARRPSGSVPMTRLGGDDPDRPPPGSFGRKGTLG